MNKIIYISIILTVLCPTIISSSTQIPSYLLGCYRNNVSQQLRNLKIPLTNQVVVELVRNVEVNLETVLDMRTMASSMLHSLKFDGIQRASSVQETEDIIPVGPTSMHFSMFKLLTDYLLPGEAALFPMGTLTMQEMCVLHFIMSSSVQAWERGDESKSCPKEISIINTSANHPITYIQGARKSTCPIERGVMRTLWGDVAPGRLLTGIVAALNQQDVKLARLMEALTENEGIPLTNATIQPKNVDGEINNLWAATIAGDLAEVVVYQGKFVDKLILGPTGVWNDSLLPRTYYLPNSIGSHWEMTSAEVLGGIDGVLIASKMSEWTKQMGSLRMSQLIDMYYSRKGISFDSTYSACQRKERMAELLKTVDLYAQTANVAKLLTYSHVAYQREDFLPQPDEIIEETAQYVVESFQNHLNDVTDMNSNCEIGYDISPMDILAVLDGTWTKYEARQLIAGLLQVSDVSFYGSNMGFISGSTGIWLTNVTDKIFNIFADIHRGESESSQFWPISFSLTKGLETVAKYMQNKTDKECTDTLRSTRATVVLVLANTAIPNDSDLDTAQRLITIIKSMQPGTTMLYITSNSNSETYENLSQNVYMNDVVVRTNRAIEDVVQGVYKALKEVPRQIMEIHCGISPMEYEDYITPGQITLYEIPYYFVQTTTNIKVQFIGNDYGNVTICANDKDFPNNVICKQIPEHDTIEFVPQKLCEHEYACFVQFKATVDQTKFKCAEDDCRFPDQARIKIRTSWNSSSQSIKSKSMIVMLTFLLNYLTF